MLFYLFFVTLQNPLLSHLINVIHSFTPKYNFSLYILNLILQFYNTASYNNYYNEMQSIVNLFHSILLC